MESGRVACPVGFLPSKGVSALDFLRWVPRGPDVTAVPQTQSRVAEPRLENA